MSWLKTPWSIQGVVRQDETDWHQYNKYRQKLPFSYLEHELLFAGEHPLRFVTSLVLLYLLTLLAWHLWLPNDVLHFSWADWEESERFAHFTVLWTVQATLVALVYPIVIAFVTVFLQRRPTSETFVHLYILDSGALVAGMSSLVLVLVMTVQYLLIPTYGIAALPGWAALDSIWFLLNAALTTFFLYRTIEFLRPEVQAYVVRRYAVNVALPRDVQRLYSYQVLAAAHSKGWIPVPSYLDQDAADGPKILISRYGFGEGTSQGKIKLKKPVWLHNVRLWPLRLVATTWIKAASKFPVVEKDGPLRKSDWPLLSILISPGQIYQEELDIAKVSAGPQLATWQRLLIRSSLSFRSVNSERYGITVQALLEELEADARIAIASGDVSVFEKAYEALVSLHELLLGASLVKQDNGDIDSWSLLPETQRGFGRELHTNWVKTYRSIFEAALDRMDRDTAPIRRICHVIQHLDGPELQASPVSVRDYILEYFPVFMYELGTWWTHRVEEQGEIDHSAHRTVALRPPLHRVYEEALEAYIAGWERGREAIARIPDRSKDFAWQKAAELARLNATHIKESAKMLLAAVTRGDRVAAEWFADVVSKWWGSFDHEQTPFGLYGKTDFITLDEIEGNWDELLAKLALSERDLQRAQGRLEVLQRSVLLAALKNFWVDVRLLTVELLINWTGLSPGKDLNQSLALEISSGLLNGKQWHAGGNVSGPLNQMTANDYLLAKIRQYAAGGELRGGYVGRLSSFVERNKDIQPVRMIGSRIYSFSGSNDVSSLQESQMALLILLSENEWAVGDSIQRQVEIWLTQSYDSIPILRATIKNWIARFKDTTEICPEVVTELLSKTQRTHDAAAGRLRAEKGIQSLQTFVEKERDNLLDNEPIDPERLTELAMFASKLAFKGETGAFPLQMFGEISAVTTSLKDFSLTMGRVHKGELTKTEIEQRVSNEEEFWSETVQTQVGAIVLSDVLEQCEIRDIYTPDAASYWAALKEYALQAKSLGLHSVLILDNSTRPEWVWEWQHSSGPEAYPRPSDMLVQRLNDHGTSYVCDINEITVYSGSLPPGQSILLAKEAFRALKFEEFAPGRFIDVSHNERTDSKHLIDLVLRFSRETEVGHKTVVRLNYASSES